MRRSITPQSGEWQLLVEHAEQLQHSPICGAVVDEVGPHLAEWRPRRAEMESGQAPPPDTVNALVGRVARILLKSFDAEVDRRTQIEGELHHQRESQELAVALIERDRAPESHRTIEAVLGHVELELMKEQAARRKAETRVGVEQGR